MNKPLIRRCNRALWPAVALMVLTGCSLLPSPEPVDQEAMRPTWENHRDDMEAITQWDLDGRVSARTDDDGANFNVRWEQAEEDYNIRISGPLGQSVATVTGSDGWARLETSDNTLYGDSLEGILAQTTSIDLPLHLLRYWVRGIPAPDSTADFTLNDVPVIVSMEQEGWTVDYRSYHDDLGLPRRLDIERGEHSARIVISVWNLE